jgi:hypothetical protein
MPPAQQRFKSADAVGGDIDQRLVVKFERLPEWRAEPAIMKVLSHPMVSAR